MADDQEGKVPENAMYDKLGHIAPVRLPGEELPLSVIMSARVGARPASRVHSRQGGVFRNPGLVEQDGSPPGGEPWEWSWIAL